MILGPDLGSIAGSLPKLILDKLDYQQKDRGQNKLEEQNKNQQNLIDAKTGHRLKYEKLEKNVKDNLRPLW